MKLTVNNPDELIAAIPHVLGFKPHDSMILLPLVAHNELPAARVDLPRTADDRDELLKAVSAAYLQHIPREAQFALVCVSTDRGEAELASQHLADGLSEMGMDIVLRLWSDNKAWANLATGSGGPHSTDAATRVAATTVLAGALQPADTREALEASFHGHRAPIDALLPQARANAEIAGDAIDRAWAMERTAAFKGDGQRLSNLDGARLLVALETIETRDALWTDMTRANARTQAALWSDLTRRAPDDVRAAPATLAAFSCWLTGDGARAWCALDQVPPQQSYLLASVVVGVLQRGGLLHG